MALEVPVCKILNRWNGSVLWEVEAASMREAVGKAVAAGANLRDANLTGANLTDAALTDAVLTPIRDDLWAVLSAAPAEVPALIAALKAGKVDGSAYQGECACLVGTIANARGCEYTDLGPALQPNNSRPAERFFLAINKGDTPATSEPCRLATEWSEDWLTRMRACFSPAERTTA